MPTHILTPALPALPTTTELDTDLAAAAFDAVRGEIDAVEPDSLSPMNVDVDAACTIALGAAPAILAHRESLATLPDFEARHVDKLVTYAKAALHAYRAALPSDDDPALPGFITEVTDLRTKLLLWAVPLVAAGAFSQAALDRIKEGAGQKDGAGDLISLVPMYRAKWDEIKNMCGVTEADLDRAEVVGVTVFGALARRESLGIVGSASASMLLARKAWTLLDRAYFQCRRGLAYLRAMKGDADEIAPSMRRNSGPRPAPAADKPAAPVAPPVAPPVTPPVAPVLGDGSRPFIHR